MSRFKTGIAVLTVLLLINFVSCGALYNRVFTIVFENQPYKAVIADPNFKAYADKGLSLTNFTAATHPSQPNYLAMIAGSYFGKNTNDNVDLPNRHIGDLLEEKGYTWKSYQEDYPGNCRLDAIIGRYVRKHNPFASFTNVQNNSSRCNFMVPATQLDLDLASGSLPTYSFFTPNMDNGGHDTDIPTAGAYLDSFFKDRMPRFPPKTLFVITWDEDDYNNGNHIYTVLISDSITPKTEDATPYNFYSLLRSYELNFGLGSLGTGDVSATPIEAITPKPDPPSPAPSPSDPHPPSPPPTDPNASGSSSTGLVIALLLVVIFVIAVTALSVKYRETIRAAVYRLWAPQDSFSSIRHRGGNSKLFDEEDDDIQVDLDDSDELR